MHCGMAFAAYRDRMQDALSYARSEQSDVNYQLLHNAPKNRNGMPSHYVVESRSDSEREIFVVVRGTAGFADAITNAFCTSRPIFNGRAHSGIVEAAEKILDEHFSILRICSEANYRIRLVGHSLGGGTASLIATMLKQQLLPDADVRATSFASPACVSSELAKESSAYVTSVVNAYDCVPRMSVANGSRLLDELHLFDWQARFENRVDGICDFAAPPGTTSTDLRKRAVESLRNQLLGLTKSSSASPPSSTTTSTCVSAFDDDIDTELVPPGRIIYVDPDGGTPVVVDEAEDDMKEILLNRLLLTKSLFSDHMIVNYARSLGSTWGGFDLEAEANRKARRGSAIKGIRDRGEKTIEGIRNRGGKTIEGIRDRGGKTIEGIRHRGGKTIEGIRHRFSGSGKKEQPNMERTTAGMSLGTTSTSTSSSRASSSSSTRITIPLGHSPGKAGRVGEADDGDSGYRRGFLKGEERRGGGGGGGGGGGFRRSPKK
eukprot:g611.t1